MVTDRNTATSLSFSAQCLLACLHYQMASRSAGNLVYFQKVTQGICYTHGGGGVQRAACKHGVNFESMETGIIKKHSYSGHDCANFRSLCMKNALRFTALQGQSQSQHPALAL